MISSGTSAAMRPERRPIRVWVDADALWELLRARGISQNELARRAGITGAYLSQLVNRRRSPSFETMQRLRGALDVTFHDIFVIERRDGD